MLCACTRLLYGYIFLQGFSYRGFVRGEVQEPHWRGGYSPVKFFYLGLLSGRCVCVCVRACVCACVWYWGILLHGFSLGFFLADKCIKGIMGGGLLSRWLFPRGFYLWRSARTALCRLIVLREFFSLGFFAGRNVCVCVCVCVYLSARVRACVYVIGGYFPGKGYCP